MSIRLFSILIFLSIIFVWLGWGVIIFNISPQEAGFLSFTTFYLSLFLSLFGTFFIVGKKVREKFFKKQLVCDCLTVSLRQALFFSGLLVGLLVLQRNGLANWLNIILLILILTALEFFCVSREKNFNYERQDPTT